MFEEEKLGIPTGEEPKVQHAAKRGFPEIVRVLVLVFGQSNFGYDDVQPCSEVDGAKISGLFE